MKILVVDDSKTMRYVLITQLKEIGYTEIEEADTAEKAKLLATADPPSLIISDWNMPGGASGLDLLRAIRNNPRTSEIPFIILTTDSDRHKIVEATRAGLQSYLLKPIKKEILVEKLHELAAAYGFAPPLGALSKAPQMIPPTIMPPPQEDTHPLKGKVSEEQISDIVNIFTSLWSETSVSTAFKNHLTKSIFGTAQRETNQDVERMMETVLNAAQEGIRRQLSLLV